MDSFWELLSTQWGWALALAAVFFAKTKFALSLLNNDAKAALSLWLDGSYNDTWSQSFCRMFDGLFGENHFSLRCFWRSSFASVLAVFGMWALLDSFGILRTRANVELDWLNVLAIGLFVNVVADYVSLLETRFVLHHIHRAGSVILQGVVLIADAIVSGVIILVALRVYSYASGDPFSAEMIFAAFSALSVFFFSTFITSIWTWGYILSTWFIRSFNRLGLHKVLDIQKRPDLIVAFVGAIWVGGAALALSLPNQSAGTGPSTVDRLLCAVSPSGEVCEAQHRISQNNAARLYFLSQACARGRAADQCFSAGMALYEVTPEDAAIYWSATCEGGNAAGCTNLGFLFEDGLGVDKDPARAAELYTQGCEGGNAVGCTNLGVLFENGLGVDKDPARAAELYTQGCEGGNAVGCTNLGFLFENGLSVDKDPGRAAELYTQGCEGGHAVGCTNLGFLFQNGLGVDEDPARAAELYTQGCEGGNALGCTNLGFLFQNGLGVDKDPARAAELYTQACEGGEARGCTNLGVLFAKGQGVDEDPARAAELYTQGCEGGNALGCTNLGLLFEDGLGVDKDPARAAELYTQGCEGGDAVGCSYVADLYERGAGVPKDLNRAIELYEEGCAGGSDWRCDRPQQLRQELSVSE